MTILSLYQILQPSHTIVNRQPRSTTEETNKLTTNGIKAVAEVPNVPKFSGLKIDSHIAKATSGESGDAGQRLGSYVLVPATESGKIVLAKMMDTYGDLSILDCEIIKKQQYRLLRYYEQYVVFNISIKKLKLKMF